MWRSLFLAGGVVLCIFGLECLVVEKAVLQKAQEPLVSQSDNFLGFSLNRDPLPQQREFTPPEWAPWSLISIGAIIIIYSYTIPKRVYA